MAAPARRALRSPRPASLSALRGDLADLVALGLVETRRRPDGHLGYHPTARGREACQRFQRGE